MKNTFYVGVALVVLTATAATMRAQSATTTTQPATQASAARPPTQAAATQPTVTLINMHLRKVLPQQVFEELSKQSGVEFEAVNNLWDQDSMQEPLDVDLADRPFWSAMNELCDICNVTPQMQTYVNSFGGNNGQRRITLFPGGHGAANRKKLPTFERDGFLVQATGFSRQQTINYNFPEHAIDLCSVQVIVYVDPAIHVSSFNPGAPATAAVDDQGSSMLPDANAGFTTYPGGRQISLVYNCNIPLKYPANAGKKIADLKFTLQLRGSTSVEKMTVDSPLDASDVTKDLGDASIIFHSLKKSTRPGGYDAKVGVISDNEDYNRDFYGLLQTAQMLDSKGRPFSMYPGGGGGGNGSYEYTIVYSLNPNGVGVIGGPPGRAQNRATGVPVKWVLELPTKTHAIKLPVEFKDLPLP